MICLSISYKNPLLHANLLIKRGTPGIEHTIAWAIPAATSDTLAVAAASGRAGRREAVPVM